MNVFLVIERLECVCSQILQIKKQAAGKSCRNTPWHTYHPFIYIYSRLTVHSGYTVFYQYVCVSWESNPQPFALLTQCSTTEPQEHIASSSCIGVYFVIMTITALIIRLYSTKTHAKKLSSKKSNCKNISNSLYILYIIAIQMTFSPEELHPALCIYYCTYNLDTAQINTWT